MTDLDVREFERREAEAGLRRPVRVLYVVDHTQPSAANKQLVRWLGQFRRMQLKAAVACLDAYGDAVEKIQGKNVPVVSIEMDRAKGDRLGERFGALMRLKSFIGHNNPEVVHLIGEDARNLGVLAVSSFSGLPVITEAAPAGGRGLWSRLLDGASRLLAPPPILVHRNEEEEKSAPRRNRRGAVSEVIGHGIDVPAAQTAPLLDFEVLTPGTFDIGLPIRPGRLEPVLEMLDAFRIFHAHCPEARLVLFGEEKPSDLEPWCSDAGLSESVLFRELPPEPASLFSRLNAMWVHDRECSDQEAALQAMAVGLPVVIDHTTGLAPGIREIGGALMRDGSWPQQFAEATRELMHDAELRENVGRAGKELVKQRFSVAGQAERLRSLYARLVHGADV